MTRFTLYLTTLLMLLPLAAGNVLATEYGKQKVVYHINYDNPKQQAGALRNIQNHINAVGAENLDVKVVLHGNGLAMLVYPDSLQNTKRINSLRFIPPEKVQASWFLTPPADHAMGRAILWPIPPNKEWLIWL